MQKETAHPDYSSSIEHDDSMDLTINNDLTMKEAFNLVVNDQNAEQERSAQTRPTTALFTHRIVTRQIIIAVNGSQYENHWAIERATNKSNNQ